MEQNIYLVFFRRGDYNWEFVLKRIYIHFPQERWLQLRIFIKKNIYLPLFKKSNYNWKSALKRIYINLSLKWGYTMKIGQYNLSYDYSLSVYICNNIFYLCIVKLLSHSSFVLFGTTDLILYTNLYFDTKCNKPKLKIKRFS